MVGVDLNSIWRRGCDDVGLEVDELFLDNAVVLREGFLWRVVGPIEPFFWRVVVVIEPFF